MLSEANYLTNPIGKSITRNIIAGTEQLDQVLLLTETGGYIKLLVGIANPFRPNTENWTDPTIQPTIAQSNQFTGPVHSDWE